jgi:hypothetical protein
MIVACWTVVALARMRLQPFFMHHGIATAPVSNGAVSAAAEV